MKQITYLLLSLFFIACNTSREHKELTIEQTQKLKLKQLFMEWLNNELAKGNLWASDSCNLEWITKHRFDGMIENMRGLPDSSDLNFSYADINSDGQLDQLATFTPSQCDGGNASMWVQIAVLTISENGKYKTTTSIGDGISSSISQDTSGFYWYDSIGPNIIYATFYNFKYNDGHCCPSIKKPVAIIYDSKKIVFTKDKQ